jgi:acyl carrier protein
MKTINQDFVKDSIRKELLKEKRDVEINSSTLLKDFNLDSFSLLSIASEIEDEYSVWLIKNPQQIREMQNSMETFGEFVTFLEAKINDATRAR